MPLEPGTRLGAYHVEGLLATGGMGEVYRGHDERLGRDVAIKIVAEGLASEDKELERFQREARTLASLSHPNVLSIFDFGEHNGVWYAVTELLRGENLRQRMAKQALPWRTATAIAVAVARGLAAAHAAGIVHRDLKPENVFLLADGGVKVLDFGLAHREQPPGDGKAPVPPEETLVGTALYMAPEQICGEPPDPRTDIFGLGVLLYEMLTGDRPFGRGTVGETMSAIMYADAPPMSAFGANVPPPWSVSSAGAWRRSATSGCRPRTTSPSSSARSSLHPRRKRFQRCRGRYGSSGCWPGRSWERQWRCW